MSERLDRIEAILEQTVSLQNTQQIQIDVLIEGLLEMQKGQRELRQTVDSLAKSVQAHCNDQRRHSS